MKRIYQAANNIEAHMLVHLLEQAGVQAHVEGEHLQSGAGELPLGGLAAVAVADEDVAAAREVIREWEARTTQKPDVSTIPQSTSSWGSAVLAFVVGAALSGGLVWSIYNGPTATESVDHDGDGKTDEHYIYSGNRLVRMETDRNFDGSVDAIYQYAPDGLANSESADDDFDGRMETTVTYRSGQPVEVQTDFDGDGRIDYLAKYRFGVIQTYDYLNYAGSVVKRVLYRGSKTDRVELDLNADGRMERRYRFDKHDEPIEESVKE